MDTFYIYLTDGDALEDGKEERIAETSPRLQNMNCWSLKQKRRKQAAFFQLWPAVPSAVHHTVSLWSSRQAWFFFEHLSGRDFFLQGEAVFFFFFLFTKRRW